MNWIPAISTSALFAFALWLLRNVIITRLTKSVGHEYDKKIENLRAGLRQSEESFRSELRAKESQIDALRTGALSGIINRQAALYQRQIMAVEQIWDAVVSLAPAKGVSATMAILKFDVAAKEAAKEPRFREVFANIGKTFGMDSPRANEALKARPFLSQLAWAYYSAYEAIVVHAVLRLRALQSGLEKDLADVEAITRLVRVALPHQAEFIEKFGPEAFHYLLEELESSLLGELRNILQGESVDRESVERAALIIKEAERLMKANESLTESA